MIHSSKKKGQIGNFQSKLASLKERHPKDLRGAMYFVDPQLTKNRRYYEPQLSEMAQQYGVRLDLYYGNGLFFDLLGFPNGWGSLLENLEAWRDGISELEELDFDQDPERHFREIHSMNDRYWRKLLDNEALWGSGVMTVIFSTGATLEMLREHFAASGRRGLAASAARRLDQLGSE